jgi:hypothetical protein
MFQTKLLNFFRTKIEKIKITDNQKKKKKKKSLKDSYKIYFFMTKLKFLHFQKLILKIGFPKNWDFLEPVFGF